MQKDWTPPPLAEWGLKWAGVSLGQPRGRDREWVGCAWAVAGMSGHWCAWPVPIPIPVPEQSCSQVQPCLGTSLETTWWALGNQS